MSGFQVPKGKMSRWLCSLEHISSDRVTNGMKELISRALWCAFLFLKCCFWFNYFPLRDFIHLGNNLRGLMLKIHLSRQEGKKKIPMQEMLWLSTEEIMNSQEKRPFKIHHIMESFQKPIILYKNCIQKPLSIISRTMEKQNMNPGIK